MTTEKDNCPLYPFYKTKSDEVCDPQRSENIAIMSRYSSANIPNEYRNIYVSNSPVREGQKEVYEILNTYIQTFSKDNVRIKNLYLYSTETGTGKTTTSIAILSEYIRRRFLYYVKKGVRIPDNLGYFLDLVEFQSDYNLASMANSEEDMLMIRRLIEFCQTVEMLVIDDVGVRSATESFRALVHSIINTRVNAGLPTVYTSNVPMDSLNDIFDARLYDRVRDQTHMFTFSGTSKRGKR